MHTIPQIDLAGEEEMLALKSLNTPEDISDDPQYTDQEEHEIEIPDPEPYEMEGV